MTSRLTHCSVLSIDLSCHLLTIVVNAEGPKGSRAKVISELRETQRLAAQKHGSDNTPPSPAYSMNQALLTNEVLDVCVNFFFANLYPTQPILERTKVRDAIARMYDDAEAYVFVVALCAYVFSTHPSIGCFYANLNRAATCAFSPIYRYLKSC